MRSCKTISYDLIKDDKLIELWVNNDMSDKYIPISQSGIMCFGRRAYPCSKKLQGIGNHG